MRCSVLSFALATILATASIGLATTIHVPADHPTIQAGIDAAVNGDTVLVADGTYTGDGNRDVDFTGKAIVVKSENGPENCVIDCRGTVDDPHRGFIFQNGEGHTSILQGFAITNGHVYEGAVGKGRGGGILCLSSSPTITGNVIQQNTASQRGGGILIYSGSPLIVGNIIKGNSTQGQGGGIICSYTAAWIEKNLIAGNAAYHDTYGGGGIYCNNQPVPIINGNTVSQNWATAGGGGVYCSGTPARLTNNIIWENGWNDVTFNSCIPKVTYCDVGGGWPGTGNINRDPRFLDPGAGEYELLPDSPCVDAGDPLIAFDPDGTRADMGVFYLDHGPPPQLYMYVVPDTTYCHRGDTLGFVVNVTNTADTTIFFQGWTEGETPEGLLVSPLLGPIDAILGAHETVSPYIMHLPAIPWGMPLGGPYVYRVVLGVYPDTAYAEDSFEFYVVW